MYVARQHSVLVWSNHVWGSVPCLSARPLAIDASTHGPTRPKTAILLGRSTDDGIADFELLCRPGQWALIHVHLTMKREETTKRICKKRKQQKCRSQNCDVVQQAAVGLHENYGRWATRGAPSRIISQCKTSKTLQQFWCTITTVCVCCAVVSPLQPSCARSPTGWERAMIASWPTMRHQDPAVPCQ